MEGLAYRVVPYASPGDLFSRGGINADIMFNNMVNKFRWGGVQNPGLYLDENVLRMLGNFRSSFARLALQLIAENKNDSARQALAKCLEVIPDTVVPFNVYNVLLAEAYYRLGDTDQANRIVASIKSNVYDDLNYYISLGNKYTQYLMYEKRIAFYTLDELRRMAVTYKQTDLQGEMEVKLRDYANALNLAR
jgi:tetratricopeptide (TPR) repeat protein